MRGKGSTLGLSLLPVFMWILIQSIVVLAFTPAMLGLGNLLSVLGLETQGFYEFLNTNGSYLIYLLMDGGVLIPGIFWFRRLPPRQEKRRGGFFGITPGGILLLVLAGFGLQMLSNLFLSFVFDAFPGLMESYAQVLENLGMNHPAFLSLLYTVLLAPVTEELLFRGLTLRILEGPFPFWTANTLQAFYFGVIHGNLVQGGYAFLAGLILGYLVKRKGTLAAGVLCHFGVNFSGVLLGLL